MEWLKKILNSKKVVVSLVGLTVSVALALGFEVPAGTEELLLKVIATIVGAFNVGQGLADGLSKGRTSAGNNVVPVDELISVISKNTASAEGK